MTGNGKSPENYQPEDFVTDESFINYYFHLNREDEAFWEKWLLNHPHNAQFAEAAKEILQNLSLTLSEQEYQAELGKLRKAIDKENPPFAAKKPGIIRSLYRDELIFSASEKKKKYAKYLLAAILVLVLAGYYLLQPFAKKTDQLLMKYNDSSKPIILTLSDGTVVTLAAQCIFRYPPEFGNKDRKVFLDGEAQFQVSRDEAHPFKVYTGDLLATVLGTVFNIKKQPGDSVMLIELIKGKLKVETIDSVGYTSTSIILNPDERVVYKSHGRKLFKEKWQSQAETAVPTDHLIFRQNNFEEIAKQIKTVFGVTVINQSNKKNWRFTGEFKNTTAEKIVASVCLIKNLNSRVAGDTIFISNKENPK